MHRLRNPEARGLYTVCGEPARGEVIEPPDESGMARLLYVPACVACRGLAREIKSACAFCGGSEWLPGIVVPAFTREALMRHIERLGGTEQREPPITITFTAAREASPGG